MLGCFVHSFCPLYPRMVQDVQNFTRIVQLKSKFMPELDICSRLSAECHRKGGETRHKIKEIMAAIDRVSEKLFCASHFENQY